MTDKRVYTHVSRKAVRGLQRIVRGREVFVKPTEDGYTVITAKAEGRERLPA